MDVKLLGPLEVLEGGASVSVGGGKQAALLALLAVRRGGVVSNDALVEALWDGRPPPTAPKNVQIYVSQLRKALSEHAIETRRNGYSLLLDPDHLDIARFESLVEQGRESLARGDNDAASATLGEALTLWRGPALADFAYAEFAQAEIARLEELRLAAVEDRIDADLALGRQRQLVPELEVLVRSYPVRDRFREQLMLALYRSGRQAEALEAFREARRAFVEELGIEPSRSLQDLQRRILEQDPELDSFRRRSAVRLPQRRLLLVGGLLVAGAATAVAVAFSGGSSPVHVEINAVGVVDPTKNEVVAQVPVGVNPVAIALSQGRAWVVNEEDRTVSEIDARTRRVVGSIALDGAPTAVATADGFVWVLNATTAENTTPAVEITKINPRVGLVVDRIPTDLAYGDVIVGSLAVGHGSAWVPSPDEYAPTGVLERIDLATHRVTGRYRVFGPRRASEGIVYANGAVWLHDARGLVRIDPRTGNVKVTDVRGGGGIAVGPERVWVAARFFPTCLVADCSDSKTGYIASIDANVGGVRTTVSARDPAAVALWNGSVWIANRNTHDVQRFDPKTNRRATIPLHNPPTALAAGEGAVWVVVR